ncbi:MAG: hypothetical protein RL095_133 [Verrucomicrobiota bacterium]|jgi:glucose/arabinose dehydrogenase/cytochrome c5
MSLFAALALAQAAPAEAPQPHPAAKTYESFCVSCHGKQLEGATGPKLTDSVWLHGSSREALLKSINEGFPAKGMPGFGPMLPEAQKQQLIDFILARQQGLSDVEYKIYKGSWEKIPDAARLTPVKSGKVQALLDLSMVEDRKDYLIVFTGKLLIAKEGEYRLEVHSDDAGRLEVDGKTVVNDDGIHPARGRSGKVKLAAGEHSFTLTHMQGGGEDVLGLHLSGQGVSEWLSAPLKGARGPEPVIIAAENRAQVYRGNVKGQKSPRSLMLGFPGGVNAVLDTEHGEITHSWIGKFIDVAPPRSGRGQSPALPAAEAVEKLAVALPVKGEFRGYRIVGENVAVQFGEAWVQLSAKADKSGLDIAAISTPPSALAAAAATVQGQPYDKEPRPALLPEGYSVETIPLPPGRPLQTAGLAVTPRGEVFVCSREGEVWKRVADGSWQLYAEGLHEPCGLLWKEDKGELWIAQKPELTALKDEDGDGRADSFRTLTAGWGISGNYHEFHFGPEIGPDGSVYGTLNLGHDSFKPVRGSCMSAVPGLKRGTAYRLSPEGKYETFAWGLRSPAGTGMTPDGHLLFLDNQGDWMPTSYLAVAERGSFHGHPAGMADHPDYHGKDLDQVPLKEWAEKRVPPAVFIPHVELGNSPGNVVYDATGGKFGPFAGQIFACDQTQSNVFRCQLQHVKGVWQGCAIDFIRPLRCGLIRLAFAPDGSMWTCATSRGWDSIGDLPFAVQHIKWDAQTTPFCIQAITHEKGGFRISFTAPLKEAPRPQDLKVSHWTYNFWPTYGSPKVGTTKVEPSSVTLAADGKSVFVALPELVKRRCYAFSLPGLKDARGRPVSSDHGWYTLNEIID